MAILVDPDDLNQGSTTAVSDTVFTVPGTGADVQITSAGSNMPALAAGEFFEIRDMSDAENNGLFQVVTVNTSTSDYECDKVTGVAPISAASEAATFLGATGTSTEKSIHYDTDARVFYLLEQGNLTVDGANTQTVYSRMKLDWKDDNFLFAFPFPAIAITPEQFEFIDTWNPGDDVGFSIRTRKLLRSGGWSEVEEDTDQLLQQWASVVTLGSFEDNATDNAYYAFGDDPTDTSAGVFFDFAGPVNEAVLVYQGDAAGPDVGTGFDIVVDTPSAGIDQIQRNDAGSWITDGFVVGGQVTVRNATTSANDGTYLIVALTAANMDVVAQTGGGDPGLTADTGDNTIVFDINNRNAFRPFIRVRDGDTNGKTFDQSNLPAIGITDPDGFNNRVFRFPLSNQTDLKISETDANIGSNSPYTSIVIRYFDQAFNREVDSGTNRDFGIVIDVGTHSGVDGSFSAAGTVLTTTEGGMGVNAYAGGTLRIHEGTDENLTFTIASNTATTITISGGSFTANESNISFTAQLSSPVVATAEEIYEKVQYQLRQASDVDATDQTVTGNTADAILGFVGETLECGRALPNNPNGGGSGVIIEGFSANDTNRLTFYDNTGTPYTFPFVAAGTINFNANLVNDNGPARYVMYYEYTERFSNTGFGLSSSSGDTATLDSSVTNLTTELADGDYIRLSGFADEADNGIFVLTGTPAGAGPWTVTVRSVAGNTLVNEAAGSTIVLDKNPIDSPDAIVVDNNSGADISGTIGASSVSFDFDYDNNVQGGRTAATDADVVVRAIGTDTAAAVETLGTITRAVGQSLTLVAPLERNYSNP